MVGKTNTFIGGISSDDCTATKEQVLEKYTTVTKDSNDEIADGTMPNRGAVSNVLNAGGSYTIPVGYHNGLGKISANNLANQTSGTAAKEHIYSGKIAWVNGNKVTGTMTVNGILNFSAAAYSTTQILLQWQNPYIAAGKPFSGVHIWYSTGGYPGSNGVLIYSGYGNNSASGGWSQVIVTMPAAGTGYYFSARPYMTCSAGDIWGNTLNAYAATTAHGSRTFTSSGVFTVPANIRLISVFCVGGGGGSSSGGYSGEDMDTYLCGGGGGGGYTKTVWNIAVTPGQQFQVTIGAGGTPSKYNKPGNGGTTLFGSLCTANGGGGSTIVNSYSDNGGSGGSGGGGGGHYNSKYFFDYGGDGGSDGGDGGGKRYSSGGTGQRTTTRAFGDAARALYAGGGVGGTPNQISIGVAKPGAGGGGGQNANGSANTGGGAGAGGIGSNGRTGGTGVAIIQW